MTSRGGHQGSSDAVLPRALDRLFAEQVIAEVGGRLGVNHGTAARCHESRHVSRWMRAALRKDGREQCEQGEQEVQTGERMTVADEPEGS